jgi:hypothetical protein
MGTKWWMGNARASGKLFGPGGGGGGDSPTATRREPGGNPRTQGLLLLRCPYRSLLDSWAGAPARLRLGIEASRCSQSQIFMIPPTTSPGRPGLRLAAVPSNRIMRQ